MTARSLMPSSASASTSCRSWKLYDRFGMPSASSDEILINWSLFNGRGVQPINRKSSARYVAAFSNCLVSRASIKSVTICVAVMLILVCSSPGTKYVFYREYVQNPTLETSKSRGNRSSGLAFSSLPTFAFPGADDRLLDIGHGQGLGKAGFPLLAGDD